MLPPEEAVFAQIDGDTGAIGYNETTVDVIAVPCIGASPLDTWARDPLPDDYFSPFSNSNEVEYRTTHELPGSVPLFPAINTSLPKAFNVWVRHGIRKTVSSARVLLYQHRRLYEGLTLDDLADDLLETIWREGQRFQRPRPLFFICHSIGGLVVKRALTRASQYDHGSGHRWIFENCHGITFFGTPHFGSEYLSMSSLRNRLQDILFLEGPIPHPITHNLRVSSPYLLELQASFTQIAGDICLWSFYERLNTQLTSLDSAPIAEVPFDAPLVPVQSALLGLRREQVSSLENDHVHCASFGLKNAAQMAHYISNLGSVMRKAEHLASKYIHTRLALPQRVEVELTGFYESHNPESVSNLVYSSRHYLEGFFTKGLEIWFDEGLYHTSPRPTSNHAPSRPSTGDLAD